MTDPRDKKSTVDRYHKAFSKEAAREERARIKQRKARKQAREAHLSPSRRPDTDDWEGWDEPQGAPRPRGRRGRSRRAEDAVPSSTAGVLARVLRCAAQSCDILIEGRAGEIRVPWTAADRALQLVAGDRLRLSDPGDRPPRILELLPRRACLMRPDPANPRRPKLLAAHVDLAVLVLSAREPAFRPGLIERYLVALDAQEIEVMVCIHKADLCSAGERGEIEDLLADYDHLGLSRLWTSVAGEGLAELAAALVGKVAVFSGHSGVGKSSLLNALDPEARRRVGSGRGFDGKGRHTTTRCEMRALPGDSWWIDTPGVREFGLWALRPEDLRLGYRGFASLASGCRFKDCWHDAEPGCAVRAAVAVGVFPARRLERYHKLLEELRQGP